MTASGISASAEPRTLEGSSVIHEDSVAEGGGTPNPAEG